MDFSILQVWQANTRFHTPSRFLISRPSLQYMRQKVVYMGKVIVSWLDAYVDETVETLAFLVSVQRVSA